MGCCPTPPVSPEACREGPVASTGFVRTLHEKCPDVYAYSYDDGHGLMRCSADSNYTLTLYCPFEESMIGQLEGTTHTTTTTSTPILIRRVDDVTVFLYAGFAAVVLLPLAVYLGARSQRKAGDRRVLWGMFVNSEQDRDLYDSLHQDQDPGLMPSPRTRAKFELLAQLENPRIQMEVEDSDAANETEGVTGLCEQSGAGVPANEEQTANAQGKTPTPPTCREVAVIAEGVPGTRPPSSKVGRFRRWLTKWRRKAPR